MEAWLEMTVRLAAFALVFAAMAAWELAAPRRAPGFSRRRRWPGNFGILAVDVLTVRLLVPTAVVGAALFAAGNGIGLFHWLNLRLSVGLVLGFLILDFAIWAQHYAFHHIGLLWRLHRMHHADLDFDVTTGLRFHPFEILISLAIKVAVVVAFGIPPVAVLLFEVVLNATSMFNHSNVRMPAALDRVLRLVVVTPDMHRVHHSVERPETDSNFGFNLPWWDWLFGTYRAQPAAGHRGMTIGIPDFRDPGELRLDRMLTQPFRNDRQATKAANATCVGAHVASGSAPPDVSR